METGWKPSGVVVVVVDGNRVESGKPSSGRTLTADIHGLVAVAGMALVGIGQVGVVP